MRGYKAEFDKGEKRSDNAEYSRRKARWNNAKQTLAKKWDTLTDGERYAATRELEDKRQAWLALPSMEPMDENYRRITYCRYADDFLIGVIGSHADAEKIRADLRDFLMEKL